MDMDSVLNQMRREHSPTQADKERVRTAISTAIIVGAGAGAAQLSAATGLEGAAAVKGAAWILPVWAKGAVGVSVVVAAVGGGVYGVNELRSANHATIATPGGMPNEPQHTGMEAAGATVAPMAEATLPNSMRQAEAPLPRVAAVPQADSNATTRLTLRGGKAAPDPVGNVSTTESQTLTSLGELRLIGEASKALREGRTEAARSALAEHERRYSNTALGQERAGLELLARCADSHGAETKRAAEEFLRSSPKSPLAGTIRRECIE